MQSDGRILVAGSTYNPGLTNGYNNLAVARLNSNGSTDTSYGVNGVAFYDFYGYNDGATSILIQPDGKALTGGQASTPDGQFAVVRLQDFPANL